jgi:hypothetical protein
MAFNPFYNNPFMQQKNPIITIHFYNDTQLMYLPLKFSEFVRKILYIIQIPQPFFSSLIFYYFDNNNNKFYIQSETQYNQFYKILSISYLNSKNLFIEHKQINSINNSNNRTFFQNPIFNVFCVNCKMNPIPKVVFYCIPIKCYICSKCEEKIGGNIAFPLVKICNYDALKNSLELEYAQPFTESFYSNVKEGNNVSSAFPKDNLLLSNKDNIKHEAESIDKVKTHNENKIQININNLEILIKKIKQEYSLNTFTNRQIENAIKKANGKFEQAIIYLIN